MIDDWRGKWYNGSRNQTTPLYFGFVQVWNLVDLRFNMVLCELCTVETPSNPATLGTIQSVLIRGVASFQ